VFSCSLLQPHAHRPRISLSLSLSLSLSRWSLISHNFPKDPNKHSFRRFLCRRSGFFVRFQELWRNWNIIVSNSFLLSIVKFFSLHFPFQLFFVGIAKYRKTIFFFFFFFFFNLYIYFININFSEIYIRNFKCSDPLEFGNLFWVFMQWKVCFLFWSYSFIYRFTFFLKSVSGEFCWIRKKFKCAFSDRSSVRFYIIADYAMCETRWV